MTEMGADNTFGETNFRPVTIGGAIFVYNGVKFDYCFEESIRCLQAFCDQVVVCVIRSDDGTLERCKALENSKTKLVILDAELWDQTSGKERLSYFSNVAISNLDTDWVYYQQADEVTHESSFLAIRLACEVGSQQGIEGYLVHRLNLWNTPYQYLTCPLDRQPCSIHVIRLAKARYRCVGDAESLAVPNVQLLNQVEMFHMGFVRKMDVMKQKVIHMQEVVFGTPHDARLDASDVFEPLHYFQPTDLSPIPLSLPRHVVEWANQRM